MSRDGRGNPGRIILKNQPRLRLADVLRRRRSTLKKLLDELGISTYGGLINWCSRMGIAPVSSEEFKAVVPPTMRVNSPQEGVVVLEAPPLVEESTGRVVDEQEFPSAEDLNVSTPEPAQKKRRPKKDNSPADG